MFDKIDKLKRNLDKLKGINIERLSRKEIIDNQTKKLLKERETLREALTIAEFTQKSISQYYKLAREGNLERLGQVVGEFMSSIMKNDYEVELYIRTSGKHEYLEALINGVRPIDLSGGEKQLFSLAMVAECSTNNVLVLDETINSLDPYALEKVKEYLEEIAETKQLVLVELDDNLEIPYTYIAEDNTLKRKDMI